MNELEHFSLRWNNFHSNMSSGFCALLQEDALVDVTLAAEGRILQAHKLVLSVCSPYFKQIFAANPCKHPVVILKDVHHKQLSDLLNFMYQGEVNVRQEELATFLKTAELLQIKGLTEQEPQTSHSQPQGTFRDERHVLAAKTHHFPKFRPGPVRRVRQPEKTASSATPSDTQSPAPSPPPSKRIRPAPSPVAVNDDNDKKDDAKDAPGNDEAEAEGSTVQVKTEPSSDFDNRACNNSRALRQEDGENAVGDKDEILLRNAALFQSLQSPLSPRGGPHETDESISSRTPQRLPADINASIASSSGLSITPSENSISAPESEGELYYMTSKRGRLHLLHDGHRYYLHRQGVSGTRFWRCLRHRTSGCRAYVSVELGAKFATKRGKEHNHTPPYERLERSWIPVPMKLLTESAAEATFFEQDQTFYDGSKGHPANDLEAFAEVNFIPEGERIEFTEKIEIE